MREVGELIILPDQASPTLHRVAVLHSSPVTHENCGGMAPSGRNRVSQTSKEKKILHSSFYRSCLRCIIYLICLVCAREHYMLDLAKRTASKHQIYYAISITTNDVPTSRHANCAAGIQQFVYRQPKCCVYSAVDINVVESSRNIAMIHNSVY